MTEQPTRLKRLLRQRHLQNYRTFCREYDKLARKLDTTLVSTYPSRAQFYRWLSGEISGQPYPDHCLILEAMFPGHSARALFETAETEHASQNDKEQSHLGQTQTSLDPLLEAVHHRLGAPSEPPEWGQTPSDEHEARSIPRDANLPPRTTELATGFDETVRTLGRNLLTTASILRLSASETTQLAHLTGNIVELELLLDIRIRPSGWSTLTYNHVIVNLVGRPLTRLTRELWFENTEGEILITPLANASGDIEIERVHDTANLAKFACLLSAPLQPGAMSTVRYSCEGGRFVSDHYWRQSIPRYTRHLTITVRHEKATSIEQLFTTEERTDGSVVSADESLLWDYDGEDLVVTLTRNHLKPNQAVTLRWECSK